MNWQEIKKLKSFKEAVLTLPTSKSLTQRALICASLAEGISVIKNPLISEDTLLLKEALEKVGVKIETEKGSWKVEGVKGKPLLSKEKVYLGNNGTGARFFLALSVLGKGDYVEIFGKKRLHERPMGSLIEALRKLLAKVECLEKEGYLPVRVKESELISQKISLPGRVSSQFFSALLQIAPYLPQGLEIEIEGELLSKSYIDLTLEVMEKFGVKVEKREKGYRVCSSFFRATSYEIEADASSASYFLALPLVLGKGKVVITNYNGFSPQGDTKFLDFIKEIGAKVELKKPLGVEVSFEGRPKGGVFDLGDTPDLFPTMCILGAVAEGRTILRGAPHLRYKETDRIKAMAEGLKSLGVKVEELEDGLIIEGQDSFRPATIFTYEDHRIAMSFAILGLKIGEVKIENPECVKKSFPEFWDYLERIYEQNSVNRF
ncbi:MAG: 3-phosphoshikimate 1-carboxyvinyltransferase [Thermodesulfobacteriaceae bacterium]|nr:3-phosphoshikimate 1-carboxyvinyltransferase [Thermodesulfobacteriaceae bacterium]MCX8041069.1 3-phosphoshikimate 1-carboxyvinyltransferase [Thermodesulfobacteriaceae bacterium]MDW8135510.1 3-phosphoshikimate 1-carboxyvinyltransferase [Thermodesulfobacterium sp.]